MQHALRAERPEWDLNDPSVKNGHVVDRDDPKLGASSMLVFEGDDANSPARQTRIAAERKLYNQQQAELNARKRQAEAEREQRYNQELAAATEHAGQLAANEYVARRNEAFRIQQENKALARIKKEQGKKQKAEEDELTKLELQVTNRRLNEELRNQVGTNGRLRKGEYKGAGTAAAAAVADENRRLIAMKEAQRRTDMQQKLEDAQAEAAAIRAAQDLAARNYLEAKEAELRLSQENRFNRRLAKQAEQQRNQAAKTNAVENSFFERFSAGAD